MTTDKKIIEIRIPLEGDIEKITMEALGFLGDECDDILGPLEELLGIVRETRRKPEYFQGVSRGRTIRVGE
jgi:hypothetical protein